MDKRNNNLVWDTVWDHATLIYPQDKCVLYDIRTDEDFDYVVGTLGRVMYCPRNQEKLQFLELENSSLGHHFLSINSIIQQNNIGLPDRLALGRTFFLFLHLAKIEEMLNQKEGETIFPCYTKIRQKCFRYCNKTSFTMADFLKIFDVVVDVDLFPKLEKGVHKLFHSFLIYECLGIKEKETF